MSKSRILLIVFLFIQLTSHAQTWQWARRAGGEPKSSVGSDEIMGIVTDRAGNSYSLMKLDGANRVVSIDGNIPLNDSDITTQGGGSQNEDAVLVSYDKCGKLRWLKTITSNSGSRAVSIGIDSNANIYTTTDIFGFLNVSIGSDTSFANNNRRAFMITKFDSSGKYKWLKLPTPDTVTTRLNNWNYTPIAMQTDPNGDCHIFCYFGKGLVSGSTNLVSTKIGYHVLQYNSSGKPVALTPLDIRDSATVIFNPKWTRFYRTNSGKYVLSTALIPYNNTQGTLYFGNQRVRVSSAMGMFSSTGQLLWRVNNETLDSTKGTVCNANWDEKSKSIIISGSINNGETFLSYTAPTSTSLYYSLSMLAYLDTLGQKKWMNVSTLTVNALNNNGTSLSSAATLKNNKIVAGGRAEGQLVWGNQKFNDGIAQGYIAAFDANTGNFLQLDSVKDVGGTSRLEVFTSDTNNNVYTGATYQNTLKVGSQSINSVGGFYDLCIAKWGFAEASCLLVPLRFVNLTASPTSRQVGTGSPMEGQLQASINWSTANEVNVHYFNVQRSLNWRDWVNVGYVLAKNKAVNEYSFMDVNREALVGHELYYRIESVDVDGQRQYSEIRKLALNDKRESVVVYPNPARGVVNVYCGGGIKEVKLFNSIGQQISSSPMANRNDGVQSTVDSRQSTVRLNVSGLGKGMYILQIVTIKGVVRNEKIIVE